MALQDLTSVELDDVCGGKKGGVNADITIIKIKQHQNNKTIIYASSDVDASNNQIVTIGSVG